MTLLSEDPPAVTLTSPVASPPPREGAAGPPIPVGIPPMPISAWMRPSAGTFVLMPLSVPDIPVPNNEASPPTNHMPPSGDALPIGNRAPKDTPPTMPPPFGLASSTDESFLPPPSSRLTVVSIDGVDGTVDDVRM